MHPHHTKGKLYDRPENEGGSINKPIIKNRNV